MASDPTPVTGFRFRDLPAELRHLCWDIAARREAENLIIFFTNDYRIYLTKQLISALLSATRECRFCALKVFNLHLGIRNDNDGNGKVHVNMELGTLAGKRRPMCRCSSHMSRTEEPKKSVPTSPGPWIRGPTPISSIVPVEELRKARRLVVIHFADDPDYQRLLRRSFPLATFHYETNSGHQTIFFLSLASYQGPTNIIHDLNNMGWNELNEKSPDQIKKWTTGNSGQEEFRRSRTTENFG